MTPSSWTRGLALKPATGWFAAGDSFRQALTVLSDGAFKLLALLCLEADRRSGRYQTTQKQLAVGLGKSKRIIGSYVRELQQQGVCKVQPGTNQFARTIFEISDPYWPYRRSESSPQPPEPETYVGSVREAFLTLGCAIGKFGPSEVRTARELEIRGIPLQVVQDALLVGSCRKYLSWLNGRATEPIGSLRYFEPLIAELQQQPLSANYREYLRARTRQLARKWSEGATSRQGLQPRDTQGSLASRALPGRFLKVPSGTDAMSQM